MAAFVVVDGVMFGRTLRGAVEDKSGILKSAGSPIPANKLCVVFPRPFPSELSVEGPVAVEEFPNGFERPPKDAKRSCDRVVGFASCFSAWGSDVVFSAFAVSVTGGFVEEGTRDGNASDPNGCIDDCPAGWFRCGASAYGLGMESSVNEEIPNCC